MESSIPLKERSGPRRGSENVYRKKKKVSGITKYFREYCQTTTLNGFNYLAEDRTLGEKLLWVVIILIAVAWSIYMIWEMYNKYEENPFIVSLATRESPIYTIPFPAVTICPLAKSDRGKFNYTDVVNKIWNNETLDPDQLRNGQYMSLICDYSDDDMDHYFPPIETFTDDIFRVFDEIKLGPDVVLTECNFMGVEGNCQDMFTPIILDEGVCYTFNMLNRQDIFKENVVQFESYHQTGSNSTWDIDNGYPKKAGLDVYPERALLSGADNSLDLVLRQFIRDEDYLCVEDVQGYKVHLHTPHAIPQLKKLFFSVPLDKSVLTVVQPKLMTTSREVKKYKPQDRLCYFTDERFLKFFKIYTPDNCRLECLTNFTLDICGCVNFYMPRDNSTPICGNAMLKCMEGAQLLLKQSELSNQLEAEDIFNFKCDCMPLCTELTYDMETSRSDWNWRKQFRAMKTFNQLEADEHEMHVSRLRIFFKYDQFLTSQRNELYGFMDFLANFGGLLGLFTGFSLISAAEILYYLTVRLWCNRRLYNDYTGPES